MSRKRYTAPIKSTRAAKIHKLRQESQRMLATCQALEWENHLQNKRICEIKARAERAEHQLRQLFRTDVQRVELRRHLVRMCIEIDAGLPYKNPAGVLQDAVIELVTKIVQTAPELCTADAVPLLKRVRDLPERELQFRLRAFYVRLRDQLREQTHPARDPALRELHDILSFHFPASIFAMFLKYASQNLHLMETP